jgi:bifunctional non-homologous end joining protein LigD
MRALETRRAAHTENHPLEYLDFEGIIPTGEYGAGDVIVWDHGTWEPESLDDPATSIEDGEFKLVLHGERLRGRFVIVRTRKQHQASEDWLLIHKRDDHAVETWDIDDHPTSILGDKSNEDVATGAPPREETPVAHTMADIDMSAATQVPLPAFIEPMLATPVDRPFSDSDWLYELKLDGYRVQAVVHGKAAWLWTRNRKDAAAYFPAFAAAPTDWIAAYAAVVDGEMVALDQDGRPDFSLLQELVGLRGLGVKRRQLKTGEQPRAPRRGSLVFHAFDLLHLDSWDLLDVPLEERKRLLRLVLQEHPSVRYVSHVLEHGEDFQAAVVAQGLKGSIAKLRFGRYEPGMRTRSWLKVKARREQELVVVGHEPGKGSHKDLGSVLVATHEAQGWRFAGAVGSGIDGRERKLLRQIVDEHPLRDPPTVGTPRTPTTRWCEPRHVIRAEFTEWTPDGLLRQAVYKGREVGRDPRTVSREVTEAVTVAPRLEAARQAASGGATADARAVRAKRRGPVPTPGVGLELVRDGKRDDDQAGPTHALTRAELQALEALADGGSWDVGGQRVALTNLDKVLFSEVGYTKRDLVRYSTTIAPAILPYLRERPLNVHRWPDGVEGKTQLWQKQIPAHAPDWVTRWEYPDAGRSQSHT